MGTAPFLREWCRMKILSLPCIGNLLAKVIPSHRLRAQALFSLNFERVSGRTPARFCPTLEFLEDRCMPSLIASQVLPLMFPPGPGAPGAGGPGAPVNLATVNTVTVLAPALTATSPTPQRITLTDTISGAPTGGTVTFTLPGGRTVNNVPVVNGVAQVVNFLIPAGTPGGTVTATYSGTAGFAGSTSSGGGNGILTFCGPNSASTLLLGPGPGFDTTLESFAVLAGTTVTNAHVGLNPQTVIFGDVGVSPGNALTGFPPGIVNGPIHLADAVAIQAQSDLVTAYNAAAALPRTQTLTGHDLGGLTLVPGVYFFASTAQLTGTLTLNDENNPAARFVFQIGDSLTTASGSRVQFINGGAANVYWQVGSSATLGSSTVFAGNILALTSIFLDPTASIACGRALARNGEVTLIDNFIDPAPQRPTVVVPATAAANLVTGTTTRLSVQGSSSAGAANLRYTWKIITGPAGLPAPTFSANAANGAHNTTVTFHAAGTYTFRVTIADKSGQATTSDVTVQVKQSLTSIQVKPRTATVHQNQGDPLVARALDQFGAALLIQPPFSWSIESGTGSVSGAGMYTPRNQWHGTAIIRARSSQVSGTASVTVVR
jgi:Ice-binding-like